MTPDATTQDGTLFGDEDSKPDTKPQSNSEYVGSYKADAVRLSVFETDTENGKFHKYLPQRVYTKDDGENFEYTSNMRPRDLRTLAGLLLKAAREQENARFEAADGGGGQ